MRRLRGLADLVFDAVEDHLLRVFAAGHELVFERAQVVVAGDDR